MKKFRTENRIKILKRLIVVEAIICYMTVLTVVSYVRGPERYGIAKEPLLTTEEFNYIDGRPAAESSGTLTFENQTKGAATGYLAEIDLNSLQKVEISFQIDCPEKYAGGILFVDLCNGEEGYDLAEQEYQLTLQAGRNEVNFSLNPGQEHPDTAQLRFFTLDLADYDLKNVQIHEQILLPKLTKGVIIGAGICFLVLAVTVLIFEIDQKATHVFQRRDLVNANDQPAPVERQATGKILSVGIFAFVMFLAGASLARLPERDNLIGVTLSEYPQDVSVSSFMNGNFQDGWERWFRDNFFGHTKIIKCHNQIEYSVFRDGIGEWVQGKDRYLFKRDDVYAYIVGSHKSYDQKVFDLYAAKVFDLQTKLEQINKGFVYLITPLKVEIYSEKLPWYERIAAGSENIGGGPGDHLIQAFEKYGVNYCDMRTDMLKLKQNSKYAVFPREGHHWTLNAVVEEAIILIPKLQEMIPDMTFPKLNITAVENRKFETDTDILDLQNVFWGKHSSSYCYPLVEYVEKSDASVYVFGTSMSYQISNALYTDAVNSAFDSIITSQYFTRVDVKDRSGETVEVYQEGDEPADLNILGRIQGSDLVVMESVDYFGVPEWHSKFVDYVTENIYQLSVGVNKNIVLCEEHPSVVSFKGFYDREYWGRWTDGGQSSIHLSGDELSNTQKKLTMNLSAYSFATGRAVEVLLNGKHLITLNITTTEQNYVVPVPEKMMNPEENTIEFKASGEFFSPKKLGQSEDDRPLGIAISSLVFTEATD